MLIWASQSELACSHGSRGRGSQGGMVMALGVYQCTLSHSWSGCTPRKRKERIKEVRKKMEKKKERNGFHEHSPQHISSLLLTSSLYRLFLKDWHTNGDWYRNQILFMTMCGLKPISCKNCISLVGVTSAFFFSLFFKSFHCLRLPNVFFDWISTYHVTL